MLKVDAFTHIWPARYHRALADVTGAMTDITRRSEAQPMMVDLDERFRVMDLYDEYRQILSLGSPPLELVARSDQALELARVGTEAMAELCTKYPDRFPGFIPTLPMGAGIEAILDAARHAIQDAGALGVQLYTHVSGRPLDDPEFVPLFDYMAEVDRPIWLHPARSAKMTDYATEDRSKYEIWWTFGWPYETSAAMARLVYSRIFDRHPGLKIITHHAGGMVPFFEGRVGPGNDVLGARTSDEDYAALRAELQHRPLDYFRMFYADTATFGAAGSIRLAAEFFGYDKMVFASDAPFDPEGGRMFIRETIRAIEEMDISDDVRASLYHGNLARMTGRDFLKV
ncbi:amidohydrolase family protein [Pseudoruegeria sp. HB172150]|uniref:amidohydrolase family protein n=1 Tax=Pseudoruegeria sp. HB172150 TaxID=2721164 RepID=UPI001554F657|nr:amidohydrolase family protein [Pseudoruegeria sp. HB172150]